MADFSVIADIKGELREHKGLSAFVYQRLPKPYPPRTAWRRGADIARLPSVIGTVPTGMMRTVLPQRISIATDVQPRSNNEVWKPSPRIQIAPSRKARADALRDLPYMLQQKWLKDRPVLCAVRQRVNALVGRR